MSCLVRKPLKEALKSWLNVYSSKRPLSVNNLSNAWYSDSCAGSDPWFYFFLKLYLVDLNSEMDFFIKKECILACTARLFPFLLIILQGMISGAVFFVKKPLK